MGSVDILVPDLPGSVADATVTIWHKKPGNAVIRGEVLVETETGRVILEMPASADGILDVVLEDEGTTVASRQIFGCLREGNSTGRETSTESEEKASTPAQRQQASPGEQNNDASSPTIRRLLAEHNLGASAIRGTSVDGRLTREGVEEHLAKAPAKELAPATADPTAQPALVTRSERRVPMIRLRKRVAERLPGTKNSTAMLTMFNEVSVKPIMSLRKQYDEAFEKRHDIRLGLISFYVKAMVETLERYPEVDASIGGDNVVYHNCFNVSMAVSTPRGLVTPVLRDVDVLGMADVERRIKELAVKGRDDELTVEDLTGGNFTIADGDVFGPLISTPIINPPQSAILSMHAIKDRSMAVNGQVEVLPMIYLVLPYDCRLIDGRESVGFLVTIEELLEDPTCLLLGMQ